jgi:hypothetical protein
MRKQVVAPPLFRLPAVPVNRIFPVLPALIACVASACAGGPRASIPPDHFLQGYVEAVSGQVLLCRNVHPFAEQSLLTRCTTGELAMIWKPQPLPSAGTSDTLSLSWIVAFPIRAVYIKECIHYRPSMTEGSDALSVVRSSSLNISITLKSGTPDAHSFNVDSLDAGCHCT